MPVKETLQTQRKDGRFKQSQRPSELAKRETLDLFASFHTPKCGEEIFIDKDGKQTRSFYVEDMIGGSLVAKKVPYNSGTKDTSTSILETYLEQKENKSLELAAALREIVSKPDLSSITYPSSHK